MKVKVRGDDVTVELRVAEARILRDALTKVMHRGVVLASVRAMLDQALKSGTPEG